MGDIPQQRGFVRSVEGVIRENLAKIFGNVDPKRIVVEGCSRTDRGVHAQALIAQVYCLKEGVLEALEANDETIYRSIPGKRKPHPTSSTDSSYFEPMPMDGNLSRLVFALNRMRPPDVHVTGIAPTPSVEESSPFHPSSSIVCKTYEYRISVGGMHDPTMRRWVWHQSDKLDIEKMKQICEVLQGTHDFSAFQGAPRGPDDKRRRLAQPSTPRAATCTLTNVDIIKEEPPIDDYYFPGVTPPIQTYKVVVTGDRFLYKMIRFLVGSLVAVGNGKLELEDVERAMETGNWNAPGEANRRKQFECAPAHGLVLRHADYGDDMSIEWQPLRY
jgi:tRNA pseudouridine38-40 synthase